MFSNLRYSKDCVSEILLLIITLLFASTFTVEVVVGAVTGQPEQTFEIASAALLSLGVIAGVCFAYATLIEGDQDRKEKMVRAGTHLFYSVVMVVVAAGSEWFARLYLTPFFARFQWFYWSVVFGLAVANTLFFWRAITYAYKGTMELKDTLWQLLANYRAKPN